MAGHFSHDNPSEKAREWRLAKEYDSGNQNKVQGGSSSESSEEGN